MNNVKKFRIIKFKSKPILAAKSISKSFDGRIILRKIDIRLNQGEMLGLLGSNGAGKSTFMNIVLGILTPDFGALFLGNSKLTHLAISVLRLSPPERAVALTSLKCVIENSAINFSTNSFCSVVLFFTI